MSSLADVQLHLVNSTEEAAEFMRWLGQSREVLAVDSETSGLSETEPGAKLRLVQFGDGNDGWSVPWERWNGVALEALDRYTGEIVMHNSAFDVRWLEEHSPWRAPWHRLHDTMIMAQIDDPTRRAALKFLSTKLVDKRAQAGQHLLDEAMSEQGWTWATIPVDYAPYWTYAALDTVLTARLFGILRTHERYPRVYELEMGARRVCTQMERQGTNIDVAYCERKLQELTEYSEKIRAWGQNTYKKSLGSNVQLIRLFTDLGAEITETTPKGALSMSKYQLQLLLVEQNKEISGLAQIVLDLRKAEKIANTYMENFLKNHTGGVLHPQIRTMGARTGRMSVVSPAVQTLPRGDAVVRDAFVPGEGESLISCDFSQIEMRLMAHFSGDRGLASAFATADATGGDFFTELGKDIYRDPSFTKKDPRRGLVKNTLYGAAYGAGVSKMAATAGVDIAQMGMVADSVFSSYPGIKIFQQKIEETGRLRQETEGRGYILTPYGRKLPCDDDKYYTLCNYELQGHAAEVLKKTLLDLDLAGYGPMMKLPVHDEVIFSIPNEHIDQAMREIPEIMSSQTGYAVQLLAEAEGPLDRWGTKYRREVSAPHQVDVLEMSNA